MSGPPGPDSLFNIGRWSNTEPFICILTAIPLKNGAVFAAYPQILLRCDGFPAAAKRYHRWKKLQKHCTNLGSGADLHRWLGQAPRNTFGGKDGPGVGVGRSRSVIHALQRRGAVKRRPAHPAKSRA